MLPHSISAPALLLALACAPATTTTPLAVAAPAPPPGAEEHPAAAHGHDHDHDHTCVSPALQRYVREQSAINRRKIRDQRSDDESQPDDRLTSGFRPLTSSPDDGGIAGPPPPPPVLYPFFPMAGNTDHGDIFNGQFVDLDPAIGARHDYQCRTIVVDGHAGVDCGLLSFAQQFIGVPVFAAKDGTVIFAQDGFADTNVFGSFEQGNLVVIDHSPGPQGQTIESQYYHLKNGSVAVSVGQIVKAGQQIGLAASSGNSFGPHLHFQTMINGQVYEPFAGACRAGPSGWVNQTPLDTNDLFLGDFGITRVDLNALDPPWWQPWELPTDSQFSTSDTRVNFWFVVYNFPINCAYNIQLRRPDNSLATQYVGNWGNTELFRVQKAWTGFDFQFQGPVAGTWRIVVEFDGELMIDAPFVVVNGPADPNFNRPPEPIVAAFDPPAPELSDVVFCRVSTPSGLGKEDLDWDVMRYRYLWQVNGQTVRDVTIAAQSDALAHHVACGDANLTCAVTPSDGTLNGPTAFASTFVVGPHSPDTNCDGAVDVDDLIAVILGWGPCPIPPAACPADTNDSGVVDVDDLIAVILNWG